MATITIQQAIELAVQHLNSGRLAPAAELCGQVLNAAPQYWQAMHVLAIIKHQTGQSAEGAELLQTALVIEPNLPADCHNNLGEMLRATGRFSEAAKAYERALEINPQFAGAHSNFGELHRQQKQFAAALSHYQKAIDLQPEYLTAWMNKAVAEQEMGRTEAAVQSYRKVIALAPNHAGALGNLGSALMDLSRVDEALGVFQKAIELEPRNPAAHVNMGTALTYLHRIDEAVKSLQQAIALDPQRGDAHNNLAHALLLRGDWLRGWEEYEWRWSTRPESERRRFNQPMWDGSDPRGKRILIHAEQGLGDALQFIRYAPILADRGATVIVESYPSVAELLGSVRGVSKVIPQGQPLPEFDLHIPIMSLPRALQTTPETIPASIPYLKCDEARLAHWQHRLAESGNQLKVGLVWAGRPTFGKDATRSMPLSTLAPLAALKEVAWYSFQFGQAANQERPSGLNLIDLTAALKDFSDTAAATCALDLLITVDTAAAHLAGALGQPVWVMLPFNNDWRWLQVAETTRWYPTMRLLRQEKLGDWSGVVERVRVELLRTGFTVERQRRVGTTDEHR